jgi:hypothetical protein
VEVQLHSFLICSSKEMLTLLPVSKLSLQSRVGVYLETEICVNTFGMKNHGQVKRQDTLKVLRNEEWHVKDTQDSLNNCSKLHA